VRLPLQRRGATSEEALAQLRELVAAEGGELAGALAELPATEVFAPLLAAAERCRERAGDYALLVEGIFEGYLVHYRRPRLIEPPDEDLRLLAGDYLYALGLSRLAALGDLTAVRELADVIGLCAEAHAGAAPPSADTPEAIWALGAIGVAGGPWNGGEAAKDALREQREDAPGVALEAALRRAAELGIALEAQHALIAFRESTLSESVST
jgi:hypothetical protein